jgi:tetratricopeptide (TPR) repeat protein
MIAIGGGWGGTEDRSRHRLVNHSAHAYFALGHRFLSEIKFAEAIGPLEKAVKLKPDYLAAWRDLGTACAYDGGIREEGDRTKTRRYRQAIAAFEQVRRLQRRDPDTCFNVALLYFDTRQFGRSIDAFHAGIRLSGKRDEYRVPLLEGGSTGDVYLYIGDANRFLGRNAAAIAAYQAALASQASRRANEIRLSLGEVCEKAGQPERALESYLKYLEGRQLSDSSHKYLADDADVYLRIGLLQANAGHTEESANSLGRSADAAGEWIEEWENVAKTTPDVDTRGWAAARIAGMRLTLTQAAYNLGVARLSLNQPAEAARAFDLALKTSPAHAAARYNLGLADHWLGDDVAAGEQLRLLRGLDPALAADLDAALRK